MDQVLSKGQGARQTGAIRLADVAPFNLGGLYVEPACRRISGKGATEILEPRTMQVLVCLAQSNGQMVSRDSLILACWEGRIVGDDALNRVISQLRRFAAGPGANAFRIETITKVGYRLLAEPGVDAAWPVPTTADDGRPPSASSLSRRTLLAAAVAGSAASAATAAFFITRRRQEEALDPARLLLAGTMDQRRQAEALLTSHLVDHPDDQSGLGLLALAHALSVQDNLEHRRQGQLAAGRAAISAARKADPGNADGAVAEALFRPLYRAWSRYEAAVAAAATQHPDHWAAHLALAHVRCQSGFAELAVAPARRAARLQPLSPGAHLLSGKALWTSGDLLSADRATAEAMRQFPFHNAIFQLRFDFLALTGRASEARALGALGWNNRPADQILPLSPTIAAAALDALEAGTPSRRRDAVEALVSARRAGAVATFTAAPWLAALGDPEAAFSLLPAYFTGQGPVRSAAQDVPHPASFRNTDFLFLPPIAPLWNRADVRALLSGIGLEADWQATGRIPDFRR